MRCLYTPLLCPTPFAHHGRYRAISPPTPTHAPPTLGVCCHTACPRYLLPPHLTTTPLPLPHIYGSVISTVGLPHTHGTTPLTSARVATLHTALHLPFHFVKRCWRVCYKPPRFCGRSLHRTRIRSAFRWFGHLRQTPLARHRRVHLRAVFCVFCGPLRYTAHAPPPLPLASPFLTLPAASRIRRLPRSTPYAQARTPPHWNMLASPHVKLLLLPHVFAFFASWTHACCTALLYSTTCHPTWAGVRAVPPPHRLLRPLTLYALAPL